MSRQQWGHGYYQAIKDIEDGTLKVNNDVEKLSTILICTMCNINRNVLHDKSLFSVKDLLLHSEVAGIPQEFIHKSYNFIMANEPYGCYVSGENGKDWLYDYFVLPNLSENDCVEIINNLTEDTCNKL